MTTLIKKTMPSVFTGFSYCRDYNYGLPNFKELFECIKDRQPGQAVGYAIGMLYSFFAGDRK